MTIERILYDISEIALKNNLVNASYAGPSIYNVNGGTVVDYPYVFTSPTDDIVVGDNTTTYGLTLYFVDRLLEDSSNEVDIFSVGVETIKNLIRQLRELDEIVSITETPVIRLFTDTQKMADNCAGAYVRFEITALNTAACAVYFDETGAPIGTYIPSVIKDTSVLDNLASKPWVAQYVATHASGGTSGGTDVRTVQRMIDASLSAYTRTEDFASINGSGITDNESYDLLERDVFNEFLSGYSQDKESIYEAISASTPEDYEALRTQVSANTENIAELSAFTSGLTFTVTEQGQKIEQISGATSGISADLAELSASTETLSGATSDLRAFLGDLSAFTYSAVSATTQEIEALSAATSALSADVSAVTGNQAVFYDYAVWSSSTNTVKAEMRAAWTADFNAGKRVYMKATTSGNETVYLLLESVGSYDQWRYASDAYVCHISTNNTSGVGQSGGKATKTDIITTGVKATKSKLGCVQIGDGLNVTTGGVISTAYQVWEGSQEDYDLIPNKNQNTFYVIK